MRGSRSGDVKANPPPPHRSPPGRLGTGSPPTGTGDGNVHAAPRSPRRIYPLHHRTVSWVLILRPSTTLRKMLDKICTGSIGLTADFASVGFHPDTMCFCTLPFLPSGTSAGRILYVRSVVIIRAAGSLLVRSRFALPGIASSGPVFSAGHLAPGAFDSLITSFPNLIRRRPRSLVSGGR